MKLYTHIGSLFFVLFLVTGIASPGWGAVEESPAQVNLSTPSLEVVLGEENAPVTMIMYYSLTCCGCHSFYKEVLPGIKKKFVNPEQVRLIIRDFPTDRIALQAAKLSWYGGVSQAEYSRRAEKFGDALWIANKCNTQENGDHTPPTFDNLMEALHKVARESGFSEEDFKKCLADSEIEDAIVKRCFDERSNITHVPAFIINGEIQKENADIPDVIAELAKKSKPEADPKA